MKINRKKFFLTAVTSFLGITFLKGFLFNNSTKVNRKEHKKIQIKINPFAVSRNTKENHHA